MRKIILVGWMIMNLLSAYSKDFNEEQAIKLAAEFLTQLRTNRQFSYDDERKYFPDMNLYSVVILSRLGYLDEKGVWLKAKPKISFLCELIRLKREFILQPECDNEIFLTGKTGSFSLKNNNYSQWPIDTLITCIQRNSRKKESHMKIIVFYYRIPQKRIDFPVAVNGVSLASELGFFINDNGIPELRSDILSKLRAMEKTKDGKR